MRAAALLSLVILGACTRELPEGATAAARPPAGPGARPASPPRETAPSAPPPRAPPTESVPLIPADDPRQHPDARRPTAEGESAAGDAPAASWGAPLSDAELRRLERYAAFSEDGLAYAYAEPSGGAPSLFVISVPTRTVERVLPLASPADRQLAAGELSGDGFPPPAERPEVPSMLTAQAENGTVRVLLGGMPASRPTRLSFDGAEARIRSARVLAVSRDGRQVAVRVVADGGAAGEERVEHLVLPLFE